MKWGKRHVKRIIYSSLVLVLHALCGVTNQERFLQACKAYRQGNYTCALAQYQQLPAKASAVWYNMGNCWYQLGNYARARACWLSARPDASWNERAAIEQNMRLIRYKCNEPIDAGWYIIGVDCAQSIPLLFLQILFLATLYLLFFSLWRWRSWTMSGRVVTVVLFVMVIVWGAMLGLRHYERAQQHAVISCDQASVFAGPDTAFYRVTELGYAKQVTILQTRNGWYRVGLQSIVGWIPASSLVVAL